MVALAQAYSKSRSQVMAAIIAITLGLSIVYIAGHAQSSALHEAAHDVRHVSGFPCH